MTPSTTFSMAVLQSWVNGKQAEAEVVPSSSLVEVELGVELRKMHESFCVLPMKGSVPRICKNIFKKVSQKNRNFRLKIGYNSACNIKYTQLLKVEYLLNGRTDL